MPNSVHAARWISQLTAEGWDIYIFPSLRAELNPSFHHVSIFAPSLTYSIQGSSRSVQCVRWTGLFSFLDKMLSLVFRKPVDFFWKLALTWVIRLLKPDFIQSLEIQHAAYLVLSVREQFKNDFPKWAVTNWGNDIFLFGRFFEHAEKIRSILRYCDYYSAECHRDVNLAMEMGYRGKILPVIPNAGGYNLERIMGFRQGGAVSARKVILLKGYQNWAGRALVGLRSLARCADVLNGYRVVIFAASPDVVMAANLFSQDTGIPVDILPNSNHDAMLRLHGQARIYIGLNISDGISISSLEAILMGAFPIQSCTACSDEWIVNGVNGFIVPPEDPDIIAVAIREAVLNDSLVDSANEYNKKLARERLDEKIIEPQVIAMYKEILAERDN